MKRFLLVGLVVGLLAGPAFAGMYPYTFDVLTARALRQVSLSEGGAGLTYVGNQLGTNLGDKVFGTDNYYGSSYAMQYLVGFTGHVKDLDGDAISFMEIGITEAINRDVFDAIQSLGSFDSFELHIANDNDDFWQYKLWVDTDADSVHEYETEWVPASPGLPSPAKTFLTLDFGGMVDFGSLTGIGFGIQLNRGGLPGDGDEFHTSIVPVPGAVLLGVLGLGAAGIRLRKRA